MDENNNGDKPRENGWQTVDSGPAGENDGYIPPPPPPAQAGEAPVAIKSNDTVGIIGLIAGIVGLLMACCPPLGIVLGITALVCGFVAKSKGQRFAVAGIVLGILAVLVAIIFLVLGSAASMLLPEFMDEIMREFY